MLPALKREEVSILRILLRNEVHVYVCVGDVELSLGVSRCVQSVICDHTSSDFYWYNNNNNYYYYYDYYYY